MRARRYVAPYDPSVAHVRALGRYLRSSRFSARRASALSASKVPALRAEALAQWTVSQYPSHPVPSVFIGSASGALVHLCAALKVPWLPQTTRIEVKLKRAPKGWPEALEIGRKIVPHLLGENPEWVAYQLYDPVRAERAHAPTLSFHLKRTGLGEVFRDYVRTVLPPGGTIFVSECRRAWPVARISPRHLFQPGALGDELHEDGSEEDEALELQSFSPPELTELAPEAEWGFDPALMADLESLARERDYRLCRVLHDAPEDLSPLAADLYAWWYRERRQGPRRLLVETGGKLVPFWVLRTGSVPFWLKSDCEADADRLEEYLEDSGPWESIHLMLSELDAADPEATPSARWRELLSRAQRSGDFLGVDPDSRPGEAVALLRYEHALRSLAPRYALPGPMSLSMFERFLAECGTRSSVKWVDHAVRPEAERVRIEAAPLQPVLQPEPVEGG